MIAITGATGHLGNVLTRTLAASGKKVRAVVLPFENLTPLAGLPVEIVTADVRDLGSLEKAFQSIDTVYHLAGIISLVPGKDKLLKTVNIAGTRNVTDACLSQKVRRLVYTSSIHAFAEQREGHIITESTPVSPDLALGMYGKTKAAATLSVLDAVRRGLDAVMVYPTGIIGPFDFKLSQVARTLLLFLRSRQKFFIEGQYDFVDVRDVAEGLILAGERGKTGQGYILSGENITIIQLYQEIEKLTGIKAPSRKAGTSITRIAAGFSTFFGWLTGKELLFTNETIEILNSNPFVSCEKAQRELGFTRRPIYETIADTIRWLIQNIKDPKRDKNLQTALLERLVLNSSSVY